MTYEEWECSVPATITADSLWKMKAYRLSLFLSDLGWHDTSKLAEEKRTVALSSQLYRALGSISANLAEGYSRSTGKDRALFYQYALGSARESRDWYYKGRHVLGQAVTDHRLQLLTDVVRLMLTIIPQQRSSSLHDNHRLYQVDTDEAQSWVEPSDFFGADLTVTASPYDMRSLLSHVPMPE